MAHLSKKYNESASRPNLNGQIACGPKPSLENRQPYSELLDMVANAKARCKNNLELLDENNNVAENKIESTKLTLEEKETIDDEITCDNQGADNEQINFSDDGGCTNPPYCYPSVGVIAVSGEVRKSNEAIDTPLVNESESSRNIGTISAKLDVAENQRIEIVVREINDLKEKNEITQDDLDTHKQEFQDNLQSMKNGILQDFPQLQEKTNLLLKRIDEMENQLKRIPLDSSPTASHNGDNMELKETFAKMQNDILEMHSEIQEVKGTMTVNDGDGGTVNNGSILNSRTDDNSKINDRLSEQDNRLSTLESEHKNSKEQSIVLHGKVEGLEALLNKQKVASLPNGDTGKDLQENFSKLQNDIKELHTALNEVKISAMTMISEVKDKVSSIEIRLSGTESQVHQILNNVKKLESGKANVNATKNLVDGDKTIVTEATSKDKGLKEVIIPKSLQDEKDSSTLQLIGILKDTLGFQSSSIPGNSISGQDARPVIVPCVIASRMGSDIQSAINTSQLKDNVRIIMILFHHIAKHNQLSAPSSVKIQDDAIINRCNGIIDILFWQKEIYQCETNDRSFEELRTLLKQ